MTELLSVVLVNISVYNYVHLSSIFEILYDPMTLIFLRKAFKENYFHLPDLKYFFMSKQLNVYRKLTVIYNDY